MAFAKIKTANGWTLFNTDKVVMASEVKDGDGKSTAEVSLENGDIVSTVDSFQVVKNRLLAGGSDDSEE